MNGTRRSYALLTRSKKRAAASLAVAADTGVLMSATFYRIVRINGLAGSVRYLLAELARDGSTETLLSGSFESIEEAEKARFALTYGVKAPAG